MSKRIRLAYDIISKRAIETESGVNIDAALNSIVSYRVVTGTGADSHPDVDTPSSRVIYLVMVDGASGEDAYKDWIWHGGAWVCVGGTSTDLSEFVGVFQQEFTAEQQATARANVGLDRVDNTSDSDKKTAFTGAIAQDDSGFVTGDAAYDALLAKADRVQGATGGNLASLDQTGNLADSGKKVSDFATSAQGGKADSAIQGVKLAGAQSAITPDAGNIVTIPDAVATGDQGETNGLMTAADKAKLAGIASGAEVNVQSDWSVTDSSSDAYIANKPNLATVATSGQYSDLTGTPNLATVATSGQYSDLTGTPNLATVATSGQYSDLSGTPNLATVATSGQYSDLSGTPVVTTTTVGQDTFMYTYDGNKVYADRASKAETDVSGNSLAIGLDANDKVASIGGKQLAGGDVMTGATASTAGTAGLVPAPGIGDQDKVLKGDGTWGEAASSAIISYNSVTEEIHFDFSGGAGN
jgi:hypothetical protein